MNGACEHIVVVSGDTDLLPAIRSVRSLAPGLSVIVASPYCRLRHSVDLERAATSSIRLTQALYSAHQFDDPFVPPNGDQPVEKPATW